MRLIVATAAFTLWMLGVPLAAQSAEDGAGVQGPGVEVVEADEDSESQDTGPTGLDEITITATKRSKNLQDVALSVTALGSRFLEDSGLSDLRQITQYTPNLQIIPSTDTRSTAIRIRGIGSTGNNSAIDPSVGMFIDGIYQGRSGMQIQDLFDIERIEVLRGPQGTLYGKNTAAGAIVIHTKRPTYDYEFMAERVFNGTINGHETRGLVNVPLIQDRVATRLNAYHVTASGFDTISSNGFGPDDPRGTLDGRTVNDDQKWGVRSKTLVQITDDIELMVSGDYSRETPNSFVADILDPEGVPQLAVGFADLAASTGGDLPLANGFDRIVQANVDPSNTVVNAGVSADLEWEFDNLSLTAITGYRHYETDSLFDGDFSAFRAVEAGTFSELDQVSVEARLASPGGEDLEWLTGFFFHFQSQDTIDTNGFQVDFTDAAPAILALVPSSNTNTNDHRTYTAAVFADGTYDFTEKLEFGAGLRLNFERKTRDGHFRSTFTGLDLPPIFGPDIDLVQARTALNASGRLNLRYRVNESASFYVAAANGFKSGGFNQLRTIQTSTGEFDDELSINGEVGARTNWFDNKVIFNNTFFYTWYKDYQQQLFDGVTINVVNAATLQSLGIESELMYRPIPEVSLRAAGSFNYTEFLDYKNANQTADQAQATGCTPLGGNTIGCFQDLTGARLENAPRWNISLVGGYEPRLLDTSIFVFFRGEYSWRSWVFLDSDQDRNLKQDGYGILNLRAGFRDEGDRWEITAWIANVTDENYLVVGFDVPIIGGFAAVVGPPRTGGLTARIRF